MTELIGHLHPLLVHLPIGILLLGCFFQLLVLRPGYAYLQPAIGITLFWGMLSAVAACLTGYLLSGTGDYDEQLVTRHQWFGIAVAALAAVYYACFRCKVINKYSWAWPLVLITLVSITGHLGGSLTHGSDYLTGSFTNIGVRDAPLPERPIPNVQEAVAYTDLVQPLLQRKCYSCHGPNKQKGKLRMDQIALLMKGGKDGVVLQPGNAEKSELMQRILLEKSDEKHMPPKEKPQLTEKELALLHWWIASGASFDKKTKELSQPEKIKPILLSLQNKVTENKPPADVPANNVEKADAAAIKKLTDKGVVLIPVALNSNYLVASFVSLPSATDSDVRLLLPLKKQLVWLKLNDTKVSDSALTVIAQCSNITRLELANTRVTDKGLAQLTALQQLQSVNIVGTAVTAAGLLALKNIPGLRSIYFYRTAVKAADWAALKKAFPAATLDSGGYRVPLFETDTMLVKPPKKEQ